MPRFIRDLIVSCNRRAAWPSISTVSRLVSKAVLPRAVPCFSCHPREEYPVNRYIMEEGMKGDSMCRSQLRSP